MGKSATIALICVALAASACNRSSNALNINTQAPPQPLPSQPTGDLQSSQLEPLGQDQNGLQQPGIDGDPNATNLNADGTQVASLDPSATQDTGKPLTHESLAGAWNILSTDSNCRLFLSFTQWSGGYRAGTRSCTSDELTSVSAWDVKGSQVILMDSNGAQIASLGSVGAESYAGQTAGGKAISFNR